MHLLQFLQWELSRVVIVESVSLLQALELVPDDASEGWTNNGSGQRYLCDAAYEQINVLNTFIDQWQSLHNLVRDDICQIFKSMNSSQPTELSVGVVSGQTMISSSLDVQGDQVHAEALVLGLEEMVGQLLREDVVKLLSGLSSQTHQEPVQVSRGIDQLRVKESIPQWNSWNLSPLKLNLVKKTESIKLLY